MYLVCAKDVGVVVKVTKCGESMFMVLELDKPVTQRFSHRLTLHGPLVIHHPALRGAHTRI